MPYLHVSPPTVECTHRTYVILCLYYLIYIERKRRTIRIRHKTNTQRLALFFWSLLYTQCFYLKNFKVVFSLYRLFREHRTKIQNIYLFLLSIIISV